MNYIVSYWRCDKLFVKSFPTYEGALEFFEIIQGSDERFPDELRDSDGRILRDNKENNRRRVDEI